MDGGRSGNPAGGDAPPRQQLRCTHAGCAATFSRDWKLKEHETVHTGAVRRTTGWLVMCRWMFQLTRKSPPHSARVSAPWLAAGVASPGNLTWVATCFSTKGWNSLSKFTGHICTVATHHEHSSFYLNLVFSRCKFATCTKSFFNAGKLKRHVSYAHGEKSKYFKVCLNA